MVALLLQTSTARPSRGRHLLLRHAAHRWWQWTLAVALTVARLTTVREMQMQWPRRVKLRQQRSRHHGCRQLQQQRMAALLNRRVKTRRDDESDYTLVQMGHLCGAVVWLATMAAAMAMASTEQQQATPTTPKLNQCIWMRLTVQPTTLAQQQMS